MSFFLTFLFDFLIWFYFFWVMLLWILNEIIYIWLFFYFNRWLIFYILCIYLKIFIIFFFFIEYLIIDPVSKANNIPIWMSLYFFKEMFQVSFTYYIFILFLFHIYSDILNFFFFYKHLFSVRRINASQGKLIIFIYFLFVSILSNNHCCVQIF